MIQVDAVIIGGGAQGLWLLNHLNALGYRAILFERTSLGAGQTCHAHALIHRGHYYDDPRMMIVLNAAAQFWLGFLNQNGIRPLNRTPAVVGFTAGIDVELHRYFWDYAGLRYEPVHPMPAVLQDGVIRHLFETDEFSLDAAQVVGALAQNVSHCVYRLDDEKALEMDRRGARVTRVRVRVGGRETEIEPEMVFLCAGENNLRLLEQLDGHLDADGRLVQARRKSTMLCLRSPHLEPLTAVFPVNRQRRAEGLFICSRTCPDTQKPVWLVSDHNSTPFNPGIGTTGDATPDALPQLLHELLISLHSLLPRVLDPSRTAEMDVAVYTGLTSERDFGHGTHMTDCYVEPLGFENVLTIWPTKLTLTPYASDVAARFLRTRVPVPPDTQHGRRAWPRIGMAELRATRPPVAIETWRRPSFRTDTAVKSDWQAFEQFRQGLDLAL